MQHGHAPRFDRYGKKCKDLLVDYINDHNNRALAPDQLVFGDPVTKDDTGLTEIVVGFSPLTGWSDEKEVMAYYRVEPAKFLFGKPMVIYISGYTSTDIYNAIYQQYGILIEPGLVELELVTRSFPDAAPNTQILGFQPVDDEPLLLTPAPRDADVPAYLENRNYRLRFKQTHLIFFGEIEIYTRRAVESLGTSIDSLMDLREYYSDGNMNLPQVDLLIPRGELFVDELAIPAYADRRAVEAMLFNLKQGDPVSTSSKLPALFRKLTKDDWISVSEMADFNLCGAKILYNGLVYKDYTLGKDAYNYVVAIELSGRCQNLTGIIKIGYRYSDSKIPGNNPYNQASVLPLFIH